MSYLNNFDTLDDVISNETEIISPAVVVINDDGRKRVLYKRIPNARDEELFLYFNNDYINLNNAYISIPLDKIIYTTTDGYPTITEDNNGLNFFNLFGLMSNEQHGHDNSHCEMLFKNQITRIDDYAFFECSNLKSIILPNIVESIGNFSFCSCGLEYIDIPNNVEYIGEAAFIACNSLKSVKLPNSLTQIDGGAFNNCTSLESIIIPNSVTRICRESFAYCFKLESINIPDTITEIEDGTFCYCTGLTSITIPNSVTSIGENVFVHCTGLTSITIPNSVTSIGQNTFGECENMISITCLAIEPPSLQSANYLDNVQNVYVPAQSVDKYKNATNWSNYGNKIKAI